MGGLVILIAGAGLGALWFERTSNRQSQAPQRPAAAAPLPVVEPLVHLTSCDVTVPGEYQPNFVGWEVDRDKHLFSLQMWWWDEGEARTFDYDDPSCLNNPTLGPYIKHGLERSAATGRTAEDPGGGP